MTKYRTTTHLLILLYILIQTSRQQTTCDATDAQQITDLGYEQWEAGAKYYKLHAGSANHLSARLTCQGAGARLAVITDADDLAAAKHYYQSQ